MQEMTLEEIHDAELYVLKKVDAICRKLDLKYWVMFGTLIGAVREHGFIPWDDDLDIVMKRDDYDKLIQYFMLNGGGGVEGLNLDHVCCRKHYNNYIARISESRNVITTKYKSGLFIDIYPMDGLNGLEWKTGIRKKFTQKILHIFFWYPPKFFSPRLKNLLKQSALIKILRYTFKFIVIKIQITILGYDIWHKIGYRILDCMAQKYKFDSSEWVGIPGWVLEVCWKKEFFDETVYFKFEDFEVPAPVGYDEILRASYGDYMQLPPENQRKPHHGYTAYKP